MDKYNCVLESNSNENELLLKQLIREIEELSTTTEAKLLLHDGKIAECCKYLKDNLSNSIRCLLDDMKLSGEIDGIINDSLNKFYDKFENIIDPDDFIGFTDVEKLQAAINQASDNSKRKETTIIQLNRVYDITGDSLKITKPQNREKLTITGNMGGLVKNDSGYMFEKINADYVSDIEIKDITLRGSKGTKLFKSPDFINVYITNCKLDTIDTIVDSETYMQNIHVVDTLITGGNGDLFKACGFYGLFLLNNTIEHRSGYVVKQDYKSGNMYDACYFIDMAHNLIEGFTSGGIAYLKKIAKVNITNNYFESMKNNIMLDSIQNVGVLSVDNNRVFVGANENEYSKKGLINVLTNTYPDIHVHANKVENCYLVAIEKSFSVTNQITLKSNDVTNANTTDKYTENGNSKNHEINVFPLISLTGSENKYDRTIPVISDKKYVSRFELKGKDVRLVVFNGEILSTISSDETYGVGKTNVDLYFGIPAFSDDLCDVQLFSQDINVKNKYRFGGGNDKYILLVAENDSDSTKVVTTIGNLKIGSGVRG